MKIDFKFDRSMLMKYSIIAGIAIAIFIYLISVLVRFNSVMDKNNENEMKLNKLVRDISREQKSNEKLGDLNDEYINNLYFEKETDFFDYIRKLFANYRVNVNIYQSKDNEKNPEVILNFTMNSRDFFKLVRDMENGKKFLTIKSLTVKKEQIPNLKIYMKITGYYR